MPSNMVIMLRWIIAVPAGVAAWIALNFVCGITFGAAHGFETVSSFWNATDMNGMPISGTHILVVSRIFSAAALVGVIVYIVPRYHKQVAVVVAVLVCVAAAIMAIYVLFQAVGGRLELGLGGWYRTILEMFSIIVGATLGAVLHRERMKRGASKI